MGHCAIPDIQTFKLLLSESLIVTVNYSDCHIIASDPIITEIQENNTRSQNMT